MWYSRKAIDKFWSQESKLFLAVVGCGVGALIFPAIADILVGVGIILLLVMMFLITFR